MLQLASTSPNLRFAVTENQSVVSVVVVVVVVVVGLEDSVYLRHRQSFRRVLLKAAGKLCKKC